MRRLLRHLFTLCAAASLLIGLIALAGWVLTLGGWGVWTTLQGPYTTYTFTVSKGNATFQVGSISPDPERPATARWQWFGGSNFFAMAYPPGSIRDTSVWSRVGLITTIEYVPYSDGLTTAPNQSFLMMWPANCRNFVVPLWLVCVVAAVMPVRWASRRVRERIGLHRIRQGCCPSCGYDLRASPGRCPECGAAAAAAADGPRDSL